MKTVYITRQITKAVKETEGIKEWGMKWVYNDKRKDGTRRLKFMRNGAPVSQELKSKILQEVGLALAPASNIKEMGWKVGERLGYGPYDYFYVVKA